MIALVAGGAGFIGSHLCDRLLAEGHEVVCVDSLITGSTENIAHLLSRPGFRFLRHDVSESLDVKADLVFHLASPASPPGYLKFPVQTSLANSVGTYNLLQLTQRQSARFLMASTSEIYGEPLEHPQKETYWGNVNPIGMRSCYDESKRFAESLTRTYERHHGLDTRIVRIFNTYGPRSDPLDGRIVPNFVTQALRDEDITVYDSGEQTRSLCYVDDLVDGIMRAMFAANTKGLIVNLGNPVEHSVLHYAQLIRRLSDSQSEVVFKPNISEDDPSRRRPDITVAQQALGWRPRVDLEDGLLRTIAWFRQKLGLTAS